MAKRWSAEDIRDLKTFAQKHSVQAIAEKMDRTVGGVAFKAHQLGLRLKARSGVTEKRARGSPIRSPWISTGQRAAAAAAVRLPPTSATRAAPAAFRRSLV